MVNIVASGSGTINKPAMTVWDFMVDPATLHLWMKDVNKPGNWIDSGTPQVVGSKYRIDYEYGRKTNKIIFEVTSSEPGKNFGVNTVEGPYPITADYDLVESADGRSTDISFAMDARSDSMFTAVMFVITGWMAKPFMRRRLNKELQDLEQALDSS